MVNNNRAGARRHLAQQAYLPPAPKRDEKVVPAYWAHYCAFTEKEEWNFWQGGPDTCVNCGHTTNPATILRNRDGQKLETVEGENLLEDRFVDWWAICCRCQRWQENVLPAHLLYGRIYRAEGENCCHHCRNLAAGMGSCPSCVVITKHRELTHTMGGSNIPGGAQDRHVKALLARRQRERSPFHPSFYHTTESTTTTTNRGMEDQKKDEKEASDGKEKMDDQEEEISTVKENTEDDERKGL
ncbi:hypothetical protein QBC40DRAFT_254345 [Triangularia verruculosa]|uniref:Uncharacterized protein n=1 Tax=Triangularia verruculosa TaxID=2587418 RepID=A0AAN6XHA1_9PEZI|nr:hypothetical protein QBC40DRAFT_254345 [Triangularia verruculosa]